MTESRDAATRRPSALGSGLRRTLPFVVASAMTVTAGITGPVDAAHSAPRKPVKARSDLAASMRTLVAAARAGVAAASASAPAATSYVVQPGDTVAAIASRHGLPTARVLALNGLGWKSLIFPGQVLALGTGVRTATSPVAQQGGRYTIERGDTISRIAARFGVSVRAVLDANGLSWSSIIYPGQTIAIPAAPPVAVELVSSVTPPPSEASAPVAVPAPTPVSVSTTYTIQPGDTVWAIAAQFGVPVQAILDANGLTASSIIYAGRTLHIPAATPALASAPTPGTAVTTLSESQTAFARIIIQVGREQGVPDYGIVIALATAMQESSLRNLDWGDRDSIGLFQQRPSTGWGTVEEILDPYHSAYLFYQGRAGYTRGLLDISGWQAMPLTVAAQKVQVSAYPDAYAKWEASARAWFAALA